MPRTRNPVVYKATCEQIKTVARAQMAAEGTASLSLRAIAREMEITAPAIYRYYPTRDDLITALIVDAFEAYAEALQAADEAAHARGEGLGERLLAAVLAYRLWALEHPTDFQLIYGNPIPGYDAPEATTTPAAVRSLRIMLDLLTGLEQAGQIYIPAHYAPEYLPPGVAAALTDMQARLAPAASLGLLYLAQVAWAHLHGMVMLEVFHHNTTTVGDSAAFYHTESVNLFRQWGIPLSNRAAEVEPHAHAPPA